jgi:hypothetical protein
MDFIIGLPKSGNKSVIMVVVDRLSKYAHFCALQHPFTTSTVAQIFMDQVFKLHGMPHSIVFDRDPTFTSNFWQELFKLQGTQLHLSTTYHPQTDGQIEVVNKCLETYLRCFASEKKNQWAQWLPLAEWWYNTSYHTTTCMTPFEAVYGQKPPSVLSYLPGVSKVQAVDQTLIVREAILCTLKENLVMAQNRMKQQADQGRSERQFEEGDQVFLRPATLQEKFPQGRALSEASAQILWSLYSSQACGTGGLSVSFAQSFEATSCFSCFMLKEGDWN